MPDTTPLTILLAAGQGTRMKSALPKVMHPLGGVPLIRHVIAVAQSAANGPKAIVIGHEMDGVSEAALEADPDIRTYIQNPQLGTAHALLAAREALEKHDHEVLVLYGDTPLLRAGTLQALLQRVRGRAQIAVLGFHAEDPSGYGRLIVDQEGNLKAIREDKDASEAEKSINFCNSGVFAFGKGLLPDLLDRIGNDNAKGEYYLTDTIELATDEGLTVATVACAEEEVLGVNTRAHLAQAEHVFQTRLREQAMSQGVTMVAPDTVYLSFNTKVAKDVVIEPFVHIGKGVTIEEGAVIRSFSHLEGTHVHERATVGPYARLRPGTDLAASVRVGNFVEVKEAKIEEGAKINHLTYVGDARVGPGANIGAGTITCNYDGFAKHITDIGAGAFIGSNTSLVAPVKIGDGAYVGSGSVITKNVSPDSLALARAPQTEREGWAAKFRKLRSRAKAKRKATESNKP